MTVAGHVDPPCHAEHDAQHGRQHAGGAVDAPEPRGGLPIDRFDQPHSCGKRKAKQKAQRHDRQQRNRDTDNPLLIGRCLEDGGQ